MASNPGNPFDPTTTQAKKIADAKKKATADAQAALSADKAAHYATTQASTKAKMKAAADGKAFGYENPPFDPRVMSWSKGLGAGSTLQRGYLEQDASYWKGTGQSKPYRVNFLYNPSVISVSYESNLNVLPSDAQTGGQDEAQALISSMQSVVFSLLFDRTYEVASLTGSSSVANRKALEQGVYADIAALERCVGIYRTIGSALGGQGPMLRLPINLVFGRMGILVARPLSWFGFIAGMGVDYTHFGYNMTPMRATATITFSQLAKYAKGGYEDASLSNTPASTTTAVAP